MTSRGTIPDYRTYEHTTRPISDRDAVTQALHMADSAIYYGHPPQASLAQVAAILSRATTVAGPIYRKASQ